MALMTSSRGILIFLTFSASLVLIADYVFVLPVFLSLVAISYFFLKEEYIPQAFIIAALVLVGDLIPQGRAVVNYAGLIMLLYYYVRLFGLSFADKSVFREPMYLWVYGLFVVFVLAMLFSSYSFFGLTHFIRMVVFFTIIHLLYSFLKVHKRPQYYITSLLIVGGVLSFNVFYGFITSGFSLLADQVNALQRISGLLENVNNLGTMLCIAIPFIFLRGYASEDRRIKLAYYGLSCFVLVALLLTNTRSALLVVIVYIPFLLYYLNVKALKILTVATLSVLLLVLFIEDIYQLFAFLFRLERVLSGREVLWDTALNIINDRWLFGIGPGAFRLEAYNYLPVVIGSIGEETIRFQMDIIDVGHAHNFYLFYFSEMGIGGFIVALMLPIVFLFVGSKNIKYYRGGNLGDYYTVLAIQGTGLGMFVRGFIEANNLASYGWLTGDLSFWILFMVNSYYYSSIQHVKAQPNT